MRFQRGIAICLLALLLALAGLPALAQPARAETAPINAYDLIAGVNAFRATRGLGPLKIHPSLMASAQGQADYQAANSILTHTGPGGTRPIDRARANGYGGGAWIAIAENIALFPLDTPSMLSVAIYQAWADDLHLNTMLNTGLQHAGAGVAVANGMVYLTLDTGWIAGPPLVSDTPTVSGTPPTRTPVTIIPYERLVTSTPLPDGSVYHVVGYGQVLVNIATAYGVKPGDVAALNRITPDKIYAGQKLLIRPSSTPAPPGAASALAKASLTPSPSPPGTASDSAGRGNTAPDDALAFASPIAPPASEVQTAVAAGATPSPTSPPAAEPATTPLTTNQVAIFVAVACGAVAIILVSLKKK